MLFVAIGFTFNCEAQDVTSPSAVPPDVPVTETAGSPSATSPKCFSMYNIGISVSSLSFFFNKECVFSGDQSKHSFICLKRGLLCAQDMFRGCAEAGWIMLHLLPGGTIIEISI